MSLDAAIALATVAEAKVVLKIPSGTTSEDTVLEDLINRASAHANKHTGRQLLLARFTEFYDGDGSDELMLNNYPVGTLTSVHDDPLRDFAAGSLLVVDDDYILDAAAGIISAMSGHPAFLKGKATVKVVYTAGYALASVPHDLKEAVLMMVQHHYKRMYQDQRIGLASESIGDQTFTYSEEAIPKKAKATLDRYRRKSSGSYGHA